MIFNRFKNKYLFIFAKAIIVLCTLSGCSSSEVKIGANTVGQDLTVNAPNSPVVIEDGKELSVGRDINIRAGEIEGIRDLNVRRDLNITVGE